MKKPPATVAERLKAMAEHLIERVLSPGDIPPTIAEETAAFKAVTSYLAMSEKAAPVETDDDALFKQWQEKTQGEKHEVKVSSSGRRGNGATHAADAPDADGR